MALGSNDAQPAGRFNLFMVGVPLAADRLDLLLPLRGIQTGIGLQGFEHTCDISAQHDIGTTAGHVGGDGDHFQAARLGHDVGLAGMLLGIEHLMRQFFLFQQLRDDLGVFDGGGAHQHRLAALMAVADILNSSLVFFKSGFVHPVELVTPSAWPIGRHHHGLQAINFLELVGLSVGRTGHAGKLAVKPKVILEGDRGHGLVFRLNCHPFFGLYRLVQALAPAPASHQAAGELVDDHNFTLLHHIMLVTVVEVLGTQRCIKVVHQGDVGRVIERGARRNQVELSEQTLGVFVPLLGQEHLAAFFIQGEVARLGNAFASTRIGLTLLPL